jgi:hypothetical protein
MSDVFCKQCGVTDDQQAKYDDGCGVFCHPPCSLTKPPCRCGSRVQGRRVRRDAPEKRPSSRNAVFIRMSRLAAATDTSMGRYDGGGVL